MWVGQEMKLKTVLARGQILGEDHMAQVQGRNCLGVRVSQDYFSKCGKHVLGDAFVHAKDITNIYEVSKVPVWVSPEDFITEMISKMSRNAYGSTKLVVVTSHAWCEAAWIRLKTVKWLGRIWYSSSERS